MTAPVTPVVQTLDNAFYFAGLAEHRILVRCCAQCGRPQSPPMPRCAHCGSWESQIIESDGRGIIYSWIRIHREQMISNYDGAPLPLTIVTVEFDGGWRLFGQLITKTVPEIGATVRGVFLERDGWTELAFEGAR